MGINSVLLTEDYSESWSKVSLPTFTVCTLVILSISYLSNTGDRWIPLLDSANFLFHEAGHPIFGLFFSSLYVYGGTMGQLFFPSFCSFYFFKRRQTISFYIAMLWLFENLWNVSRYMADARAQVLPIFGDGHDWFIILSRWGILEKDLYFANLLRFLTGLGVFCLWVWLTRQMQRGENREKVGEDK